MIDRGAPPARLGDPEHRLLLVGLVCLVTLVATEAMAISTVMPAVEDDLGDLWLYGWVFSAFYLGNLVGVVVGGRAVDRVAPVGPMAVGVSVFLVGLVVGGLAPSMSVLVAGRLLQGVGAGVVPAVSYVCVGRGFPEMLRPKVFAVMSTAWVVPSLVSPLLASFVADHLGWRWVFLGLVPVTVVVSVLAVPALRTVAPAPVGERARSEATAIRSVLVLVLGSGLLVGGLSLEAPIVGVPIAVLGSFVLVPAFRALTPPGTLRAGRGLAATVLSRGLLTWAFFSADAFVSLAMTSVRSASTRDAGFVLAGSSLMWTAGSWLQARTYAEWGPRRLVRLGALSVLAGCVVMVSCLAPVVPLWTWLAAGGLTGLGMGIAYAPMSTLTLALAEPGEQGAATSALQMTDILGIALGTGIAGVVVTVGERATTLTWPPLAAVFLLAAAIAGSVAVLSARLTAGQSS